MHTLWDNLGGYGLQKQVRFHRGDLVDDWRHGFDWLPHAKPGTLKAVQESAHHRQLRYELPARRNGELALWPNGIGVLSFLQSEVQAPAAA